MSPSGIVLHAWWFRVEKPDKYQNLGKPVTCQKLCRKCSNVGKPVMYKDLCKDPSWKSSHMKGALYGNMVGLAKIIESLAVKNLQHKTTR